VLDFLSIDITASSHDILHPQGNRCGGPFRVLALGVDGDCVVAASFSAANNAVPEIPGSELRHTVIADPASLPFAAGQIDVIWIAGNHQRGFVSRYHLQEALRCVKQQGHVLLGHISFTQAAELSKELSFSWERLQLNGDFKAVFSSCWQSASGRGTQAGRGSILITPTPLWKPVFLRRVQRRMCEPLLRWGYQWISRPRSGKSRIEQIGAMQIQVFPGVFNPRLFRTGEFFASQLDCHLVPVDSNVLELGTGSGICAISAARWAKKVIATDINPLAVQCARVNVTQNEFGDRIEVRQGDLFSPVSDQQFDVVLFNPPYLRGLPQTDFDRAFFGGDVAQRLADDLGRHLSPGGSLLLLLSSRGDTPAFLHALRRRGFYIKTIAGRDLSTERLALYQVFRADRLAEITEFPIHDYPV
jgi:HemK-related putative methylase